LSVAESVLKKLEEERVFSVKLKDGNTRLEFVEQCDQWFGADLTKAETLGLISELMALAAKMPD